VYIYHIFLFHTLVVGIQAVSKAWPLWTVLQNMGVRVALLYHAPRSFESKSGIAGTYCSSIFSFLRNLESFPYQLQLFTLPKTE
jgi:hypothetical protein